MPNQLPANHRFRQTDGLSLLEVVLAMAIAVLAITALVVLGNVSISSVDSSRNQAVADQYIRQALEQVRSYRDTNGWNSFMSAGGTALVVGAPKYYSLSGSTLTQKNDTYAAATDPCTFAKSGPNAAAYTIATGFYQVVTINRTVADEATVTVTECFSYRGSTNRSDKAQTVLTNWR